MTESRLGYWLNFAYWLFLILASIFAALSFISSVILRNLAPLTTIFIISTLVFLVTFICCFLAGEMIARRKNATNFT